MSDEKPLLALRDRSVIAAELLAWFAGVKRDLPWRRSDDLYGIWVSEIMLQQTTVRAVVPFWERFMARFPTVVDLAAGTQDEVLAAWSGLGYYTRARNLHAAAREICADHGECLPRTRDQWRSLPGVGPYTSGAIASIGLAEPVPALDANARRVLLRWSVVDPSTLAMLSTAKIQRLVDRLGAELVPTENPGMWNEALMELGALVCGARRPDCANCPVHAHCRAGTGDWVSEVPPPVTRSVAEPVWVGQLLVTWRNRVLLVPPATAAVPHRHAGRPVARHDFRRLHEGLWGLPMTHWLKGQEEPPWFSEPWENWLDVPPLLLPRSGGFRGIGHFSHGITKYRLRVVVYHLALDSRRDLPVARLGLGPAPASRDTAGSGLFFAMSAAYPPISKLAEKGLHFHVDTVV